MSLFCCVPLQRWGWPILWMPFLDISLLLKQRLKYIPRCHLLKGSLDQKLWYLYQQKMDPLLVFWSEGGGPSCLKCGRPVGLPCSLFTRKAGGGMVADAICPSWNLFVLLQRTLGLLRLIQAVRAASLCDGSILASLRPWVRAAAAGVGGLPMFAWAGPGLVWGWVAGG